MRVRGSPDRSLARMVAFASRDRSVASTLESQLGLSVSRRTLLEVLLTVGVATIHDRVAQAQGCTQLSPSELRTLSAAGEALVPGAERAGVASFVSARLASCEGVLFYGYLGLAQAAAAFYITTLNDLDAWSRLNTGRALHELPIEQCRSLLSSLLTPKPKGWAGLPPLLVYMVIRNDAIDVVYGVAKAYHAVGIPYMAHIEPPELFR
jgi:hypothetical protein